MMVQDSLPDIWGHGSSALALRSMPRPLLDTATMGLGAMAPAQFAHVVHTAAASGDPDPVHAATAQLG